MRISTGSVFAAIRFCLVSANKQVLLCCVILIFVIGASAKAATPGSVTPCQLPDASDQVVNFAWFVESEGLTSTLMLNNTTPEPIVVTVKIFNGNGVPFSPPPITLARLSPTRYRVQDLLRGAPGTFGFGNIQISYKGIPMGVTGQVTVWSERDRVSFDSNFTTPAMAASSRLDGIVWVPNAETRALLALTNTGAEKLIVQMFLSSQGRSIGALTLDSHETRVVDLANYMARDQFGGGAALLTLAHDRSPGALIAVGAAMNRRTGFSTTLSFADRAIAKSTRLAAAHFRFGYASTGGAASPREVFTAPLLVANTAAQISTVRLLVDYTTRDEAFTVELDKFQLDPGEVRQIELGEALARKGVSGSVDNAGVEVDYTGPVGSVIGRLASVSSNQDFCYDIPIKDPLAGLNRVGGNHPWRLEDGYATTLHLKNIKDITVFAMVQLRYEGQSYNLERVKLAPHQTIGIDIGRLKSAEEIDVRGQVLPERVTDGEVVWFEEDIGSLIGRAEISDIGHGVASSFSCGGSCPCPPSYQTSWVTPSSVVGPPGGLTQFAAKEQRRDCGGLTYGPYDRTNNSSWTVANSSIVTISSNGVATCKAAGATAINGHFQGTVYSEGQGCATIPVMAAPGTGATVRTPHHEVVFIDTLETDASCGQKVRYITRRIVDINNNHTGKVPIVESFYDASTGNPIPSFFDTCSSGSGTPFACSDALTTSVGTYQDLIRTGCPTVGGNCGFTIFSTWSWCPPYPIVGATLGNYRYDVRYSMITITNR